MRIPARWPRWPVRRKAAGPAVAAAVVDTAAVDAGAVLDNATALAARGEWTAAIELLAGTIRRQPDPALERSLVDTLLQAGAEAPATAPVPVVADDAAGEVAPGTWGIPEIPASRLTVSHLRRAMASHGHLLVRGLLSARQADTLRDCIDHSLQARANHGGADTEANPWYYPSPHYAGNHVAFARRNSERKFTATGSMPVADSPRGVCTVLEIFRDIGLSPLLAQYFGEAAVIAARKWVFRLATPKPDADDGIGGGWHQDGQFMGEGIRTLNLWLALSECGDGTRAPGIAVLPRRFDRVLEFGTQGARLNWTVGPGLVEALAQETPMVRPHFLPGDALFFDHFSLHRTGHWPGQDLPRYALESWFYATSARAGRPVLPLY